MQDSVGGDNNRTPVIFEGSDIYRFVGAIKEISMVMSFEPLQIYAKF